MYAKQLSYFSILLFFVLLISCNSLKKAGHKFTYIEHIIDSTLIASMTNIQEQHVYATYNSITFKANKSDYINEINLIINTLDQSSYKDALIKTRKNIEEEFKTTNSVNLKNFDAYDMATSSIVGLVRKHRLYVYDKKTKQVQDSIWQKNYSKEKFNIDGSRFATYKGECYTTAEGKEFLRVSLSYRVD